MLPGQNDRLLSVRARWLITTIRKSCLWVILADLTVSFHSASAPKGRMSIIHLFSLQNELCTINWLHYPVLHVQHTYGSALKLAVSWSCILNSLQYDCSAVRKRLEIIQIPFLLEHTFHKCFKAQMRFSVVAWGRGIKHLSTMSPERRPWSAVCWTEASEGTGRMQ